MSRPFRDKKMKIVLQGMVDKLGHLYDEVRGFRHDFAGIVASMEPAIANQDMAEVSTIIKMSF